MSGSAFSPRSCPIGKPHSAQYATTPVSISLSDVFVMSETLGDASDSFWQARPPERSVIGAAWLGDYARGVAEAAA